MTLLGLFFTTESYTWALCTIWSRFVSIHRNGVIYRAMIPFFDMLNHHPQSKVSHLYQNDTIVLFTENGVEHSDQLFLNYGSLSNSKLLMLYGFCIPPSVGNPFDNVELYTSMDPTTLHHDKKRAALAQLGVDSQTAVFPLTLVNPMPRTLLACLRIQFASDELDLCRLRDAETDKLSNELEGKICHILLISLRSMLAGYSTTESEDRELLQSFGMWTSTISAEEVGMVSESSKSVVIDKSFVIPSQRLQNCIIMRCGEKAILRKSIEWLEEYTRLLHS